MDEDSNLLPRDKLLRDTFTPAETLLYAIILITANVAFWLSDPRSYWLLGFFLIAGAMTAVVLKTHEHTHPFSVTFLWPKFWLCTAPLWLLLIQFIVGLAQNPIGSLEIDGTEYAQFMRPESSWLPVSTSAGTAWPTVLGFGSIHLVAIGLFIVPKSRAFFERLMPCLCLSAVLVALFGYIQGGFDISSPLFTEGTGGDDFFGFFPYDGHWAAFATLWTCACISMALLTTRYDDSPDFIESTDPWYLAGGTVLGGSAFLVDAVWPASILMLTYAVMMMLFSGHFISGSKDPHRKSIAVFSSLISVGMFAAALFRIFGTDNSSSLKDSLKQSAWEMFRDRPLFGWGIDSFGHLLPFYGSDFVTPDNYERAGNDALQMLTEVGVIGIVPSVVLIIFLILRYVKGRHNMQLTNNLLIGIAAIILLAFLDSPIMSPAVFYSFLVLFFIALRWADVTRTRADEVDAPRPQLVTPESHRRVPFHVGGKDKVR